MNKSNDRLLELGELPQSLRTVVLNDNFMISDNLDDSSAMGVLEIPSVSGMLMYTPFKLKFTIVLLCLSGSIKLRIQMNEHVIQEGGMTIIIERSICECLEISEDAKLVMFAFSSEFKILDPEIDPAPEVFDAVASNPHLRLTSEDLDNVMLLYRMLRKRIADPTFELRKEFAINGMRSLFCYLAPYLVENSMNLLRPKTRGRQITDDFLSLVESYSLEYRKLDFYAERLYITPRYLSKVVQEVSGRTAREWINMRVLLEAKVLLKEGRLSIQQISDQLNFPNQSFFGSYFKRATGMSPSRYRHS